MTSEKLSQKQSPQKLQRGPDVLERPQSDPDTITYTAQVKVTHPKSLALILLLLVLAVGLALIGRYQDATTIQEKESTEYYR